MENDTKKLIKMKTICDCCGKDISSNAFKSAFITTVVLTNIWCNNCNTKGRVSLYFSIIDDFQKEEVEGSIIESSVE